jgi:hypothetical protein
VSDYRNLSSSGAPSLAIDARRRTIAVVLAALAGLVAVFLITTAGGGGNIARAQGGTITAKALTNHECNSTEWHFVITQINSAANAPASITVEWANGNTEVVPLTKFTGGVAHYVTTSNLDSTVVSATAQIYTAWSGQFNLSHGPCGGSTPSSPPPTSPSS